MTGARGGTLCLFVAVALVLAEQVAACGQMPATGPSIRGGLEQAGWH
jgi:hypothetical protein